MARSNRPPPHALRDALRGEGLAFAIVAGVLVGLSAVAQMAEAALAGRIALVFHSVAGGVVAWCAAQLAGFALGTRASVVLAGRRAAPLRVQGLAMVACMLVTVVADRATHGLVGRGAPSAWRAGLAAPLLLLPAMAAATTHPLVAHGAARDARGVRRLGELFALYLGGGALGALTGAYVLVPAFGATRALDLGAIAVGVAGVASVLLELRTRAPRDSVRLSIASVEEPPAARKFPLVAFGSGALAGVLLIALATHLALAPRGGPYAFGLVAAILLSSFALGARRAPELQIRHREGALPRALGAVGLAIALTLPLYDRLPPLVAACASFLPTVLERELARAVAGACIAALPAITLAKAFMLMLRRISREGLPSPEQPNGARRIAWLAGVAGAGLAAGGLAAALEIVPRFGTQRALTGVSVAFAAVALLLAPRGRHRRSIAIGSLVVLAALVLSPKWNAARLAGGDSGVTPGFTASHDAGALRLASALVDRHEGAAVLDGDVLVLPLVRLPVTSRPADADRESFLVARARLTPEGVLAMPLPAFLGADAIAIAITTARAVFSYVALSVQADGVWLIAATSPRAPSRSRVPPAITDELLAGFVSRPDALDACVEELAPRAAVVSTADRADFALAIARVPPDRTLPGRLRRCAALGGADPLVP